jgi:hypothetical protein
MPRQHQTCDLVQITNRHHELVRLTCLDELSPLKLVIRKLSAIVYDGGNLHDAILRNCFKSFTDLQASLGIMDLVVLVAVGQ